jgi:tRNA nucleotidyltransferase (CCA-adding enzyme)
MKLPEIIKTISKAIREKNGRAIVVGGSVRDYFLNLPIKDYDIEVYGLDSLFELEKILSRYGKVKAVGKKFGILKLIHRGEEYDFSFPRTENKISKGHRGFEVFCNGKMDFKEASIRRDFTINAMGYDIEKDEFLDPFNAKEDIKKRLLRHINDSSFIEDPLRIYRGVQFCARFGFELDKSTFKLCKNMVERDELLELPKERVYEEFKKLLLKSDKPSIGFELMRELDILKYFPELKAIVGVPQNPRWHPEGDVWTHTLLAVNKMAQMKKGEEKRDLKLMFATLCHDLGKATHTQIKPDRISARGHELAGVEPTKKFLYRLTDEHKFINSIALLVEYHMAPSKYFRNRVKNKIIRRLSTKVDIEELVAVARADFLGRTTPESKRGVYSAGDWLLLKAKELDVYNAPPKPIIRGRDLISLGLSPSKEFKSILNKIYSKQLDGKINNQKEALSYLKSKYNLQLN